MLMRANLQECLFRLLIPTDKLLETAGKFSGRQDCKKGAFFRDRSIQSLPQPLSYFLHKPGTYPFLTPLSLGFAKNMPYRKDAIIKGFLPFWGKVSNVFTENIVTFSSISMSEIF